MVGVFLMGALLTSPATLSAAILDATTRQEVRPGAGNATQLELTTACRAGSQTACQQLQKTQSEPADEVGFFERLMQFVASIILLFIVGVISLHIIRLMYEVFHAKNLVYIRVMLPRADSKLDKERETRKDFKEKISSMTVFYNSIHKLGNIQFWDTLRNWVLKRTKMSLELVYDKGEVYFFVVVYAGDAKVVSQQITALYPDAEVAILAAKDYPEIKPQGYTLRASSIFKSKDNIYPIKPYKVFEDDPLSSLTNSFGSLKKEDVAVMQLTLKPVGRSWNKRAKKAA